MADTYKYSYKQSSKDVLSLAVYNVGYQKCQGLYQWGEGIRDHYLIHHIIGGKGYYKVNDKIYDIKQGDTFLVYPHTKVSYWADENDPWEYYWVGFNGNDASVLLADTDFSADNPVISTDFGDSLKNAFLKIYDCKGNDSYKIAEMTGNLYFALSLIIKKSLKIPVNDASDLYIEKATQFVMHNYSTNISVTDIADCIGISRSQLYKIFIAKLSVSPMDYLTQTRVRKSCNLLRNTTLPIKTIAVSVGFDNSLYFSKVFSKAKNISPSQYRKQYQN